MRLLFSVWIATFFLSLSSLGAGSYTSLYPAHPAARRLPGETYVDALIRILPPLADESSASARGLPYTGLSFDSVPELGSMEKLNEIFTRIRDARNWIWDDQPTFSRRLTWLYPADGCYMRASYMNELFKSWGYPEPRNLLIFGDLNAKTPYEDVQWVYHVAPLFKVNSQPFIIDPSMNFNRPLTIPEWVLRMTDSVDNPAYALCSSYTVAPTDNCDLSSDPWDPSDRRGILENYLGLEWTNLKDLLGRPPSDVLGSQPPWDSMRN